MPSDLVDLISIDAFVAARQSPASWQPELPPGARASILPWSWSVIVHWQLDGVTGCVVAT